MVHVCLINRFPETSVILDILAVCQRTDFRDGIAESRVAQSSTRWKVVVSVFCSFATVLRWIVVVFPSNVSVKTLLDQRLSRKKL